MSATLGAAVPEAARSCSPDACYGVHTWQTLCGARRAHAVLVRAPSDELLKVGDRGEVLVAGAESLSRGTSFAAHCARSAKPVLVGLPGSPDRAALQFNVDTGTGCRPESSLLVPCLDHVGNVLAVIQARAARGRLRATSCALRASHAFGM